MLWGIYVGDRTDQTPRVLCGDKVTPRSFVWPPDPVGLGIRPKPPLLLLSRLWPGSYKGCGAAGQVARGWARPHCHSW